MPATLPERLAHVVQRCLVLDPEQRWQSARDVSRELEWAGQKPDVGAAPSTVRQERRGAVAMAAALAAVAGVVAGLGLSRMQAPAPTADRGSVTTRTMVALPDGRRLDSTSPLAVSPDGSLLAFVAVDDTGRRDLFLRELAGSEARLVPGTNGAAHPFFAPDGRDIAFFADDFLQRVGVDAGATPFRICELPGVDRGGAWSASGTIAVAVVARGLFKVAASGGSLEAIGENLRAAYPSFLPDGRTLLYAVPAAAVPRTLNSFEVIALDGSGQRTVARRSGVDGPGDPVLGAGAEVAQGVVLASGQLVYGQDPGSVRALLIDPVTLRVLGPSVLLADSVDRGPGQGGIAFAVSSAGLLVYAGTGAEHRLAWVTREGIATSLPAEADAYRQPRLSPDGTQIAVSANDATRRPNMWLVDAVSGGRSRLASNAMMPAWSPDGRQVAVTGGGGPLTLLTPGGGVRRLIDREGLDATLARGTEAYPSAFSPDGRYLLVQANTQDVWRLSLADQRVEPVLTGATNDWGAVVSPDGRAVAYTSDASGRPEVYVAQWPGLERRTAVSTRGGMTPRWAHDSRELFFWQGRTMMAARIDEALRPAPAQALFSASTLAPAATRASMWRPMAAS